MSDKLDCGTVFFALDDLKARFGRRFIIALSGGGDSMALAHLCATWAKGNDAQVCALIIDHGLRPEAASEAKHVQAWAKAMGLSAAIHTHEGLKFTTRIQERARNLRHEAFAKAAAKAVGATILLGHTLDDQAETIAFRLSRQTGLDGLAGMAAVTTDVVHGVPIARPLLGVRREALRAYLRKVGQDWIEDPSNQNRAYSRVKVRDRLTELGGHEKLARIGELARVLRDAQDEAARDLGVRCGLVAESGVTRFAIEPFLSATTTMQWRMLAKLLGAQKPIKLEKLDRLAAQMRETSFKSATLAGMTISQKNGQFLIALAPARRNRSTT